MKENSNTINIAAVNEVNYIENTQNINHFAYGLNFYKLIWIFVFGSIIGFISETVWCFFKNGTLECRSGLLFGPFNIIYGIGALILYLCLYKINKEKTVHIFTIGIVSGTIVEYICSFVQEKAFGTVSWDYSKMPLNINGRVCLLYSAFWGLLSLAWVYYLYPKMEKTMLKIPDSIGKNLANCLFIFLSIDILLSIIAVSRWMMRIEDIPASTMFWSFIDNKFPDSHMEVLYPNMKYVVEQVANH